MGLLGLAMAFGGKRVTSLAKSPYFVQYSHNNLLVAADVLAVAPLLGDCGTIDVARTTPWASNSTTFAHTPAEASTTLGKVHFPTPITSLVVAVGKTILARSISRDRHLERRELCSLIRKGADERTLICRVGRRKCGIAWR